METQEYKTIKPEFIKSGFRFRQIIREGQFAIFHKVALKGGCHAATFDAGFEVVIIADNPARIAGGVKTSTGEIIGGNEIPAGEAIPSPEQWGTRGWTYTNLLAAENQCNSLLGKKAEIMPEVSIPDDDDDDDDSVPLEANPISPVIHRGRPKRDRIILKLPPGEFSTKDLGEFNKVDHNDAVFFLKEQLANGSVKFVREERRNVKGQLSRIFVTVKTT